MASGYDIPGAFETTDWVDISSDVETQTEDHVSMQPTVEDCTEEAPGGTIPEPETSVENEIFIAVMGSTGSGKSSFIKAVTGADVPIGHEMTSCTLREC